MRGPTTRHLLRRARAFGLALAALALAAALPADARAHTGLRASAPAAGDTVVAGLDTLRLTFTTRVNPRLTSLALTRDGAPFAVGDLAPVEGSDRILALVVPGGLPAGAWEASWRTAGADGHVITGTFAFTVIPDPTAPVVTEATPEATARLADAPASAAEPIASPSPALDPAAPLAVGIRWAGFLGLLGMIGASVFSVAILERLRRRGQAALADRAAVGVWAVALGAAALSLATLVARLWVQSASLYGTGQAMEGENLATLLNGTVWGLAWTVQALATVGFVVGLMVSRAPHGRAVGWMGAAGASLLLAWVPALSGHAAAVEEARAVALVTDFAHVLGAGAWLGTLVLLLAVGIPAALAAGEGEGLPSLGTLVDAFSPVALAGASLVAVTGVISALFHLGGLGDLLNTPYGRALLLKLGLLAGVASFGFVNWRVIRPRLRAGAGPDGLRRAARAEVALGVLVVLATAVLVALPTPSAG